jgi:hypothetical protein
MLSAKHIVLLYNSTKELGRLLKLQTDITSFRRKFGACPHRAAIDVGRAADDTLEGIGKGAVPAAALKCSAKLVRDMAAAAASSK